MRIPLSGFYLFICVFPLVSLGQDGQSDRGATLADPDHQQNAYNKIAYFPSRLFNRIQNRTDKLDKQLTQQTEKYLTRMATREERIKRKLWKLDSAAAKRVFDNAPARYAALLQKLKNDSGGRNITPTGEYQPYADSLRGALGFLQQQSQASAGGVKVDNPQQLQSSLRSLQAVQGKMQDADDIKQFIKDRKEAIKQCLGQYTHLPPGVQSSYEGLNKDIYYYNQQVQAYKDMLNDPDKLTLKALSLLNQLPAFGAFMKQHSQLAGLFGLPGSYGTAASTAGLQTRDQVSALIQNQVASAGPGGMAALQSNIQSAQAQLDGFKDKLKQLGAGGAAVDMAKFKPNDQKTKSLWKRLEYGTNFQTTRNNLYYPTIADLGLSIGYNLGHSNIIGIGFSYKMGLGNGWNHIAFSNRGVGLRSFLDIKLKDSFSATGGFEYNYAAPFSSVQQLHLMNNYWSKSGLVGITKTVSLKSKLFKKTKLQLLWDFLSYYQAPQTQPLLFRMGYNF